MRSRRRRILDLAHVDRHLTDDHGLLRAVAFAVLGVVAYRQRADLAGHVQPGRHPAEDGVVILEERRLAEQDVELAGGRVGFLAVARADGALLLWLRAEFGLEPVADTAMAHLARAQGTTALDELQVDVPGLP